GRLAVHVLVVQVPPQVPLVVGRRTLVGGERHPLAVRGQGRFDEEHPLLRVWVEGAVLLPVRGEEDVLRLLPDQESAGSGGLGGRRLGGGLRGLREDEGASGRGGGRGRRVGRGEPGGQPEGGRGDQQHGRGGDEFAERHGSNRSRGEGRDLSRHRADVA